MSTHALSQASSVRGDRQIFDLMRRLRAHAGIKIDNPVQVVESQVHDRMTLLGIDDVDHYFSLFDKGESARVEWHALVGLLAVKETRFFRQPEAFECAADYVSNLLARGARHGEMSFWSAGCATGEELYSLAMVVDHLVLESQPCLQWHGIGTDISFNAVQKAQQGIFDRSALESIPAKYRPHCPETRATDDWEVPADLKSRTHFFHSNLLQIDSAPFSNFDIVFCQNVLSYFERDRQRWIIDQLTNRVSPGGLLILGAGEDVQWLNSGMRRVAWPGVSAYRKVGG